MELKRVVVTGLGAITPIGNNVDDYWNALINGVSGAAEITSFDTEKFKTKFACQIKDFNPLDFFDRKEARKHDLYSQFGMVAAEEAIKDSGIGAEGIDKEKVGVIWASGIGGLETFANEVTNHANGDGTPRFNPFFIPKMIADIAAGHISIRNGFKGPFLIEICPAAISAIILGIKNDC